MLIVATISLVMHFDHAPHSSTLYQILLFLFSPFLLGMSVASVYYAFCENMSKSWNLTARLVSTAPLTLLLPFIVLVSKLP